MSEKALVRSWSWIYCGDPRCQDQHFAGLDLHRHYLFTAHFRAELSTNICTACCTWCRSWRRMIWAWRLDVHFNRRCLRDLKLASPSSTQLSISNTEASCTVLYCTVLYCTVLHCTVLYCTVLYCTVLYCTVLAIKPKVFWKHSVQTAKSGQILRRISAYSQFNTSVEISIVLRHASRLWYNSVDVKMGSWLWVWFIKQASVIVEMQLPIFWGSAGQEISSINWIGHEAQVWSSQPFEWLISVVWCW